MSEEQEEEEVEMVEIAKLVEKARKVKKERRRIANQVKETRKKFATMFNAISIGIQIKEDDENE